MEVLLRRLRAEIVPDEGRRGPGGGQQLRVLPGVTGRLQPCVILPGGQAGVWEPDHGVGPLIHPPVHAPDAPLSLPPRLGEGQNVSILAVLAGVAEPQTGMGALPGEAPGKKLRAVTGRQAVAPDHIRHDGPVHLIQGLPGPPFLTLHVDSAGAVKLHVGGKGPGIVPLPLRGDDLYTGESFAQKPLIARPVHGENAEEKACAGALAPVRLRGLHGGSLIDGHQGPPAVLRVREIRVHDQLVQALCGQGDLDLPAVINGTALVLVLRDLRRGDLRCGNLRGLRSGRRLRRGLCAAGGQGAQEANCQEKR